MRYLIDTNILIALEPTSAQELEPQAREAAGLVRRLTEHGDQVLLHPHSRIDLERDKEPTRRQARDILLGKYSLLESPPPVTVLPLQPLQDPSEQGRVDNAILAAVVGNAVDFLVTEDRGLHRKAQLCGVSDRVLSIADAVEAVSALSAGTSRIHPSVEDVPLHAVLDTDPIWAGFTDEYPGFPAWRTACKREGRRALVVRLAGFDDIIALSILKLGDDEPGMGGRVLKVCTFKVADAFRGQRYGELLLKAVFEYAAREHCDHAWLTAFPHHSDLTALFETFGFVAHSALPNGELRYVKSFDGSLVELCDAETGEECLATHIALGPPALHVRVGHAFIVPVRPQYHRRLFPEAEIQAELSLETDPVGNALRKAYLCNSATRQIEPGDALLFYRSHDLRGVYAIGVTESVLVSSDASELIRVVGQRTVYSEGEIEGLAKSPVLAILFRQDRIVRPPITLTELLHSAALGGPPQQISRLRPGALKWLSSRLRGESP